MLVLRKTGKMKTVIRGLFSAMVFQADAMRNVKVICSENAHFSVQKNMAMMGMGFQSVVTVPVNENAQMDVDCT